MEDKLFFFYFFNISNPYTNWLVLTRSSPSYNYRASSAVIWFVLFKRSHAMDSSCLQLYMGFNIVLILALSFLSSATTSTIIQKILTANLNTAVGLWHQFSRLGTMNWSSLRHHTTPRWEFGQTLTRRRMMTYSW